MVLTTTNGHCGVIDIGVAVTGGHITATSGRFVTHKIFLNGLIWGSGTTKINGVAGPRQAVGTGKFTQREGRRQVERHRALGRLLGRLGRRPRDAHGLTVSAGLDPAIHPTLLVRVKSPLPCGRGLPARRASHLWRSATNGGKGEG